MLTAETLARAGIELSPEEFARVVAEVVAHLPALDHAATPGLTAEQRAALARAGATLAPYPPDRRARSIAADRADEAALVAASAPPDELARRLGVDRSRVYHRLRAGRLYRFRGTDGRWRVPLFQFARDADGRLVEVPGLGRLLGGLDPAFHPLTVRDWATTPDPDLVLDGQAVSPRDWLLHGGDPAAIVPLDFP